MKMNTNVEQLLDKYLIIKNDHLKGKDCEEGSLVDILKVIRAKIDKLMNIHSDDEYINKLEHCVKFQRVVANTIFGVNGEEAQRAKEIMLRANAKELEKIYNCISVLFNPTCGHKWYAKFINAKGCLLFEQKKYIELQNKRKEKTKELQELLNRQDEILWSLASIDEIDFNALKFEIDGVRDIINKLDCQIDKLI